MTPDEATALQRLGICPKASLRARLLGRVEEFPGGLVILYRTHAGWSDPISESNSDTLVVHDKISDERRRDGSWETWIAYSRKHGSIKCSTEWLLDKLGAGKIIYAPCIDEI